jgi:DNA-binding transcriptional ArsR family regulator
MTRQIHPTIADFQAIIRQIHPTMIEIQSMTRLFHPTFPEFKSLTRQILPTFGLWRAAVGHSFVVMDDSTSPAPAGSGNAPTTPPLNAPDFFFALGSELRWAIFLLLADGKPRTATDVAAVLKRDFDGVSKHMRLMREAGVLSVGPTEDRRYVFFTIAPERRKEAGVLDYGLCTIRLPQSG